MLTYEDFSENRLKHMEMIQRVIDRLAGNSFLFKGWAITIAGAFLALSINQHSRWLAAAGGVPTVAFWGIDAYFLKSERLFRALYDEIRRAEPSIEPFFMGATTDAYADRVSSGKAGCPADVASWKKTLSRGTLRGFYGALLAAIVITAIFRPPAPHPAEPRSGARNFPELSAGLTHAGRNVL